MPSNCRWREEISHGEMAQVKTPKHICPSLQCRTLKYIGNTFWHRWRDPQKKGDGCHALFGCQNSKSRRHLHAHFGSGRGHLLLKIVYNNYLSICALNTQTQTMYTRSICLYVHMCYMYMHVLTHCRYPHIQILHCKVPYSPVHQGDP